MAYCSLNGLFNGRLFNTTGAEEWRDWDHCQFIKDFVAGTSVVFVLLGVLEGAGAVSTVSGGWVAAALIGMYSQLDYFFDRIGNPFCGKP